MSIEQHHSFLCPYCSQQNSLAIDITGGSHQDMVVDCEVCCRPIKVQVSLNGEEITGVDARKENE